MSRHERKSLFSSLVLRPMVLTNMILSGRVSVCIWTQAPEAVLSGKISHERSDSPSLNSPCYDCSVEKHTVWFGVYHPPSGPILEDRACSIPHGKNSVVAGGGWRWNDILRQLCENVSFVGLDNICLTVMFSVRSVYQSFQNRIRNTP